MDIQLIKVTHLLGDAAIYINPMYVTLVSPNVEGKGTNIFVSGYQNGVFPVAESIEEVVKLLTV